MVLQLVAITGVWSVHNVKFVKITGDNGDRWKGVGIALNARQCASAQMLNILPSLHDVWREALR